MSVIIDKFSIEDCGYYQVFYTGKQFYFTLIPAIKHLKAQYGDKWLFYTDDETMDDICYNPQPFYTINRVLNVIVDYVKKSQYTKGMESINFFFFKSSTERKDKIYEYYSKKVLYKLGDTWQCSTHQDGFYFWRNEK